MVKVHRGTLFLRGENTIAVRLSAMHISPSGAVMSVALYARRNASPSGAVMWKLRDYIVAPLGLKNLTPIFLQISSPRWG